MSMIVHHIIDYVEKMLTEKMNYEDLYSNLGYSKFYLSRVFKSKTGLTISEYYLKRRLSESAIEILDRNLNIIDIAFKYGFNSDTYFSRRFKEEFNVSPSQYRKRSVFIVLTNRIIVKEGYRMKYKKKEDLINDLLLCSTTEELKGFVAKTQNCIITKQDNSDIEIVYIEYDEDNLGRRLRTLHLNMITGHHSLLEIYSVVKEKDGPKTEMNNLCVEDNQIIVSFTDHETKKTSIAKLHSTTGSKVNCRYVWRER